MRLIKDLPVFSNGDNEQQTVCPQCGARTEFVEQPGSIQEHKCLSPSCGFEFLLDLECGDPDEESDPLP